MKKTFLFTTLALLNLSIGAWADEVKVSTPHLATLQPCNLANWCL